ncbi:type VI secretion system baseplate subunit TssF [Acetobacter thailandicus]|uniref:type VI secretion system baseplate subunit TssF n=1 Tax=Acetobacter thailandicus TaxID=1502842 RepID=UPI001BA646D1|nr:type VI secretion system baseplate subunit TssF [Acetobacter thailandicus]MBS0986204.1 type VI secretion system baseplate subunit TssF [Acetobacter thailandicus]
MDDLLFRYYNRELSALRTLAADFAQANPKAAAHLRISADTVDDPHVARLLEGLAFLSGRVHQRLDDEFPELTEGLLGILYPHYFAPVPAASIISLTAREGTNTHGQIVPRGTLVATDPIGGKPCFFSTTSDTSLWPVRVSRLTLSGLPLAAPASPLTRGARSVLRIVLETTEKDISFSDLSLDKLKFFLRGSSPGQSFALLELLCRHTICFACAASPNDPSATFLPKTALQPCGFEQNDALLPWEARSFSGFRLLTEYFAFPDKFLFVEFDRLDARTLVHDSRQMEIFVYFDISLPELERTLPQEALIPGCVPIINLFPHHCEPVSLTHENTNYHVSGSLHDPQHYEIWSVQRVREIQGNGTAQTWSPLYQRNPHEAELTNQHSISYTLSRRPAPADITGSEVYLAPVLPDLDPNSPANSILMIDALCTNRNLPERLPFGGGEPALRMPAMTDIIRQVTCLMPFSATLRPSLEGDNTWRLISHLALGHISLTEHDAGPRILHDLLTLYDCRDTLETRRIISGLVDVSTRPGHARLPGTRAGGFVRGIDVTLTFDPVAWKDSSSYLLASILERFLALHVSINSFVRTCVMLQGKPGIVTQFPPRCGTRSLL